jgi:Putative auto-transporter adhesin, head GIN domain
MSTLQPGRTPRGAGWAVACLALLMAPAALASPPEGRLYTPGSFDRVEISGSAVIRYTQGPRDEVFVEGDEEAQRAVTLEVSNGVLRVSPSGNWKFWNSRRTQLNITSVELTRLSVSGAADWLALEPVQARRLSVSISGAGLARFDHLKADALSFSVSGAGDGQVAGTVDELGISISGKSNFRGEHLQSQRARVGVSGIGDVKVWALQELAISVSGVGTVDYWGPATVSRRTSGVARINDRGAKPAR